MAQLNVVAGATILSNWPSYLKIRNLEKTYKHIFKYCLIALALLLSFKTFAQTATVSGTAVTDQTGATVPFASVYIRNTTKGTSAHIVR